MVEYNARQHPGPDVLAAYSRNSLSAEQEREVELHCMECEECIVQIERLRAFEQLWESWTARAHGEAYRRDKKKAASQETEEKKKVSTFSSFQKKRRIISRSAAVSFVTGAALAASVMFFLNQPGIRERGTRERVEALNQFSGPVQRLLRSPADNPKFRTESYRDIKDRDIEGVYTDARTSPPDLWIVNDREGNFLYAAKATPFAEKGDKGVTELNTIIKKNPQGDGLISFVDSECDGSVDVSYDMTETGVTERKERPVEPHSMTELAPQIDKALKGGVIPYPNLRLCGQKEGKE